MKPWALGVMVLLVSACDLVNLEVPKTTPPPGGETVPEDTPITVVPLKGGPQAGEKWTLTGKVEGLQKGGITVMAGQETPRAAATGVVNGKGQFSVTVDASAVKNSVDFSLFQLIWKPAEEKCEGTLEMNPKPFLSSTLALRTEQGSVVFGSETARAWMVWVDAKVSYLGTLTCKEEITVSGEVFNAVEKHTASLTLEKGWNLLVVHETGNRYDRQVTVDSKLAGNEAWKLEN